MAAWTLVQGYVKIKKNSGFSFKTYIDEKFMESNAKVQQEVLTDHLVVTFEFSFSDSNLSAAETLQKFISVIKEYDSKAWIDISTNLRFLG